MPSEALLSAARKAVDVFSSVMAQSAGAPPQASAFHTLLRNPRFAFTPIELDAISRSEDRVLAWALWCEVERRGLQERFGFPSTGKLH